MKKKRFGVIGIALAILFLLGAAPSVLAAGLPSVAIPVKVEVEGAAPSVPEEFVVQMEAEAMFTNRYGTSPVPRDSNPPKTGDESNILLYGYLALVSIAGLVVSVVIQKRGKRRSS